jgi:hypothetical protein
VHDIHRKEPDNTEREKTFEELMIFDHIFVGGIKKPR